MSIGPLSSIAGSSVAGSVAGTSLAQLRGPDVDRAQQDTSVFELRSESDQKAEEAAGVGQTDGDDHQTADRDADGRQLWHFYGRQGERDAEDGTPRQALAKDASGQCGNELDLSG